MQHDTFPQVRVRRPTPKAWMYVGVGFFVGVAILWLIADRRIEPRVIPDQA